MRRLQKRYCPVPWLDPGDAPGGSGAAPGSGNTNGSGSPSHLDQQQQQPDAAAAAASGGGGGSSAGGTPRSTSGLSTGSGAGGGGGAAAAAGGVADPSLAVPLCFVSLLRKGTPDRDRSEAKLAAAFDFVSGA